MELVRHRLRTGTPKGRHRQEGVGDKEIEDGNTDDGVLVGHDTNRQELGDDTRGQRGRW